jgi:hypothetical protein
VHVPAHHHKRLTHVGARPCRYDPCDRQNLDRELLAFQGFSNNTHQPGVSCSFSERQKTDLAGNAFCAPVCAALLSAAVAHAPICAAITRMKPTVDVVGLAAVQSTAVESAAAEEESTGEAMDSEAQSDDDIAVSSASSESTDSS